MGLVTLMYEDKADFTNTFRAMAYVSTSDEPGTVPEALDQVSCFGGSISECSWPRAWAASPSRTMGSMGPNTYFPWE